MEKVSLPSNSMTTLILPATPRHSPVAYRAATILFARARCSLGRPSHVLYSQAVERVPRKAVH